ncbi:MAG: Stk1 family PASTA domain-containing Ser/Thr kinase [Lachnospiraceae bacterium]|nr:Stk1 family PASTA domain-containing Ser/Thr kinase [bacterium]MDY5516400.1 Stk1 family PASTA domain-containing Ser/Thr kinase [Lachnospiraceae bacterium]
MIEIGSFIADRYEILEKIGAGGMSDVYKAKDQVLGRFVAVKILKPEFAEDVNFVTKFHTEAQSAAGLQHPNIVNIYDVGSEEHVHFIVMEYVEGITLKTYIEKKGQLNYKEAISIAIQVARGIEAAHNNNIVHRDIKPQNIMISHEGKVKVTDFGIARAATSNTIHSDVMGSVHYTSPEQARNGFVDGKSDIYSLGIVMYEMVTGRVPFDGDTTVSIAIQHLQEEMVAPSVYAPDLPISLEKIILKCTQKSQDRRYGTMGELLVDLKHALMEPDEDFVVIDTAVNQAKTTVIREEDVRGIKEKAAKNYASAEKQPVRPVYDDEDEDDEDEDEGFLNPKMEKAVTILGIVTAVIIIIIIIYLIGSMAGLFGGKRDKTEEEPVTDEIVEDSGKVEMIDLRGKSFDEAKAELETMGLKIYQASTAESEEYEQGQIISQDIAQGEMVEEGTMVRVVVSSGKGASEIAVPNVTGYTDNAAIGMLQDAGLDYNREYESSDQVPEGTVIRQSPESGTMAMEGTKVTIIVSQGKKSVTVPDLKNHTEEEARKALENVGLQVGTVSTDYSDTVEEGKIIDQSEIAGKTVYSGTTVNMVVSLGPKEVLYMFRANVKLPNDDTVVSANIELQDADGNVLDTWTNVSTASFPFSIEVMNIKSDSGTLVIEWVMEDEEGNVTTSTQNSPQTFQKQN